MFVSVSTDVPRDAAVEGHAAPKPARRKRRRGHAWTSRASPDQKQKRSPESVIDPPTTSHQLLTSEMTAKERVESAEKAEERRDIRKEIARGQWLGCRPFDRHRS